MVEYITQEVSPEAFRSQTYLSLTTLIILLFTDSFECDHISTVHITLTAQISFMKVIQFFRY